MSLIEGVGDEVTVVFCILFILLLITLAWISTSVRERPLNIIVLDRQTFSVLLQRLRSRVSQRAQDDNAATAEQENQPDQSSDTVEGNSTETDVNNEQETLSTDVPEPSSNEVENVGQSLPDQNVREGSATATEPGDSITEEVAVEAFSETELRQRRLAFFEHQPGEIGNKIEVSSEHAAESTNVQENVESVKSTESVTSPSLTDSTSDQSQSTPERDSEEGTELREGHIRIRLKYLDDRQRLVQAKPDDTIGTFKRQHFAGELAENMMVRFVCNGQELRQDAMSLRSYNIQDNSVIHCLLSRIEHTSSPQSSSRSTEFDFGTLMFPLFGLILALMWYCRFSYKQYFNAMSTFSLIGITFLYLVALLASWRMHEIHEHED